MILLFPLVTTMHFADDEFVTLLQHVERLVDQLDVVKVVSMVAFVGKRLLIILQGKKRTKSWKQ